MPDEVTRSIKKDVERELWARAAGRCQFNGCNRLLYLSPVTKERVNIADKAHIYSFSKEGPRGWGLFKTNPKNINDISNLMLMCHDCHKTIDQDKTGIRYSAGLLREWKMNHEQRVFITTGISPECKSHVILYGANIGDEVSPLQYSSCAQAMFPNRFPAEEKPTELSVVYTLKDHTPEYWLAEESNLRSVFGSCIVPKIISNNPAHFSLFALAPQPLLILLGSLFTDKIDVETYQPHRKPRTWMWQNHPTDFRFIVNEPSDYNHPPVLLLSLSDRVAQERITSVLGNDVSIWEVTIADPYNDFLKSAAQLSMFGEAIRKLMVAIKSRHGHTTPLNIFPVMPVACAVELGRSRMPKAEMPWIIYDQNNKHGKFIETICIK